jgi:hypothetical protein
MGFTDIFRHMHERNQHFLPERKKIRLMGLVEPGQDPYQEIQRDQVQGRFLFDFTANVNNASKQSLQAALQTAIGLYVSPLAVEMGIINPEGIWRLMRDVGQSLGINPDQYLNSPPESVSMPRITAEEALAQILDNEMPGGIPAEGAQAHVQRLAALEQDERFQLLDERQRMIYQEYLVKVRERAVQEEQLRRQAEAAQQFAGAGRGPGRPPEPGNGADRSQPAVGPNELLDEGVERQGRGEF